MAERTPLYMDINNVYSGDEMGLPNRDFISEGVVASGDMAVTAGAGNTINIAAGACWVVGDTDVVNQPTYRIINDAVVNLGINPDPTNPRQVRVGMQINDAGFSGVLRNGVLTAIHGTPAVSPAIPAEPSSFLSLATILVPAAAASSAAYTFTDLRLRARVGGGQALGSGLTLLWDSTDAGVIFPAASITTPTLPGSYRHLIIEGVVLGTVATQAFYTRVNADAGANYYYEQVTGIGAAAAAAAVSATNQFVIGPSGSVEPTAFTIRMPGTSIAVVKNILAQSFCQNDGSGSFKLFTTGGMWNNVAVVTSLTFLLSSGNFTSSSRISVYGEA